MIFKFPKTQVWQYRGLEVGRVSAEVLLLGCGPGLKYAHRAFGGIIWLLYFYRAEGRPSWTNQEFPPASPSPNRCVQGLAFTIN